MRAHREIHVGDRAAWLRAAVLGANDAIVSTASLMVGVAAASTSREAVLVAGSMSMAAGELVSVSSQRDAEEADLQREKSELATQPEAELEELVKIYVERGVDEALARQVAEQLGAKDRLGAHMRDELDLDHARRCAWSWAERSRWGSRPRSAACSASPCERGRAAAQAAIDAA